MSVHTEILTAATSLGFKPQRDGEPDATYLGRLALAANSLPDSEWSCLTPEAIEWVNASAKRLNSGKQVEACPGFGDALEGMGLAMGGYIDDAGQFNATEVSIVEPGRQLDPHCVIGKAHVSEKVPAENIALDTASKDSAEGLNSRQGDRQEHADGSVSVSPTPSAAFNKTDRIRALVMQHPEWTHAQLKDAMQGEVSGATLNTVRSVTLATIAVAKRLGLWRTA